MNSIHLSSLLVAALAVTASAQESISVPREAVTQNFNSLGTSASATLPTGWRRGEVWNSGNTDLTQAAGTSGPGVVASGSNGGAYNWANGVTATATDRAPGFLSAAFFNSPCYLGYAFTNHTGETIRALDLSWNYEKYRSGTRAFAWTFEHGSSSASLTAASAGAQAYPADANNTTVSDPTVPVAKNFRLSGLSIAPGSTYYLRWTYTGVGGSTNAQGLAIDDFSISLIAPLLGSPASPAAFSANYLSPSAAQTISVTGSEITGPVTVTAPAGFEVSFSGSAYASSVSVPADSLPATVGVRLSATAPLGPVSGDLTLASSGAISTSVALSGTVSPPVITPSVNTLTGFTAVYGSASTAQAFDISASHPAGPVTVTATAGFEVSFSGSAYASSVSVPADSLPATVGVRLSATAPLGTVSGDLTLVSSGAVSRSVALSGSTTLTSLVQSYTAATDVPLTLADVTIPSGSTATLSLDYTPVAGTDLTVVKNTGIGFISGAFSNLVHGQTVTLSHGGASYDFVVNYYGGTGNDLVLVWKNTRLLAWGGNGFGQLGTGDYFNSSTPVAPMTDGVLSGKTVVCVSAGGSHSLALCSDGTVAAWGYNFSGQLGNGTTTDSSTPVAVKSDGVLSGKTVVSVSAGYYHSLALCSDGTVAAWGDNFSGQLGDGTSTDRSTPVAVKSDGVLSGKTVVSVSAGNYHSLALCSDGTVAAWGYNVYAQLGDGTTTIRSTPVAVKSDGVLSGKTVVSVSAGSIHSLALCSDGTVAAWGYNSFGQLGDGTTTIRSIPVAVKSDGVLSGKTVVSVSAGGIHSLALCSDGTVAAWGFNGGGRLGDGTTTDSSTPVAVKTDGVLFGRTVVSVSAGYVYSLASCSDGTVAAWGVNGYGQLGTGTTTSSSTPVAVNTATLTAGERFTAVFTGGQANHTLALVTVPPSLSTSVASLGGFTANSGSASSAQEVTVGGAALVAAVTVTASAGFEVSSDGSTYASSLTLASVPATLSVRLAASTPVGSVSGDLTLASTNALTKTVSLSGTVVSMLAVSESILSGFSADAGSPSAARSVTISGAGITSALKATAPAGYEISADGISYSSSLSLYSPITAIYSFPTAFAALKSNGMVVTWGFVDSTEVSAQLTSGIKAVSSNNGASAVLKGDGTVVTWGNAFFGGDSSAVSSQLIDVTAIYSTGSAFAALKSNGTVVTWGSQYGGGDSSAVSSQLTGVKAVSSNNGAFAALKSDETVVTWGLQNGGGDSSAVSSQLTGVSVIYSDRASNAFAALKSDGTVVTWGSQYEGGDSSAVSSQLTDVKAIYSTGTAFAARKSNGTVVTWGYRHNGGDSSAVSSQLTGVSAIYSTPGAFAALKSDGTVVTWGSQDAGGDSSAVSSQLTGVTVIYSAREGAFAALKSDGTVVTWGAVDYGGDSSAVTSQLTGVTAIYSTKFAFAALKSDGTVVTWGDQFSGGDTSAVAADLAPAAPALPLTLYVRLSATAPVGPVSGNLTVSSPGADTKTIALSGTVTEVITHTHQELWRFANFGSYDSAANGADAADPDGDGMNNLLEYALGLDPNSSGVMPAVLGLNGASLEYTYTRSAAAKDNGVIYQIEWSDTLEVGSWSSQNVTEQILSTQGVLKTVKATIPAGTAGKRFVRLRVVK